MIAALNSATYGIQQNLMRLNDAAARFARQPVRSDIASDDIARDFVELKSARHAVAVNAAVVRTADDMLGTLLDTFA